MSPRRGSSTARARAITAWWGATRLTSTPPLTPTQTVIPTETPTLTPGGARCHARLLHGMPGGGLPHREPARPHRGTGEGGRPVGRALRVPRQVPPSGAAARVRHDVHRPPPTRPPAHSFLDYFARALLLTGRHQGWAMATRPRLQGLRRQTSGSGSRCGLHSEQRGSTGHSRRRRPYRSFWASGWWTVTGWTLPPRLQPRPPPARGGWVGGRDSSARTRSPI